MAGSAGRSAGFGGSRICGFTLVGSGGPEFARSGDCLASGLVPESAPLGAGCANCGAFSPGFLGPGVAVAETCAVPIGDPGEAAGDGAAPASGETKADAASSVLGGSKAPYSSGRQPVHAGSTRDKSIGSEK